MEKTLIIHPDDRSTDFLKPIYASIEKATIITGGKSKNEVVELIEQHDRTIILGHGSPNGLFAMRQTKTKKQKQTKTKTKQKQTNKRQSQNNSD